MRKLVGILAATAAIALALPAQAITFTYAWVGTGSTGGGTVGTGSISFDAAVADAANFTGLTLANVTSLSYSWTNASTSRIVDFSGTSLSSLYASNTFAAINGILSNPLAISDFFTANSFALTIAPSTSSATGISENSSVGAFVDRDQGYWRLATAVPEPESWVLMAAGLGAVLMRLRRREFA